MCLYTRQAIYFNASEDIECFKVLKEENGQWITPYRDFLIEFGKKMEAEIPSLPLREVHGLNEISEGYFHACSTGEVAQSLIEQVEVSYKREKTEMSKVKSI